jgi:DNA-binding transcriptional ArsR family regulator
LTLPQYYGILHLTNWLNENKEAIFLAIQQTLRALADPVRREILSLLKQGEQSAGAITAHFAITAAAISRHLSVLKEAELIRDRRDGKFIYYTLNTSVLEDVLLWVSELKGAETDEEN